MPRIVWGMPKRDPFIRDLLEFMHGRSRLTTRVELRVGGFADSTIDDYRDAGLITSAVRGVLLVGDPYLTQPELHTLALLKAGPGSWLSSRTAAELRGVLAERYGSVDVKRVGTGKNRVVRARVPMADDEAAALIRIEDTTVQTPTEMVDDRRAATIVSALIDLARGDGEHFERAWSQAEFLNLLTTRTIEDELRGRRRPGAQVVRRKLAERRDRLGAPVDLRTKLEAAFFELVTELGLPLPECNVSIVVNGRVFRPDFFWRAIGLAIEVDGPHHMAPTQVDADKARDVDLFIAHIDTLRFTDRAIYARSRETLALVGAAYARQALRAAGSVA